ncbi:MAG: hypothetical protein MR546_02210 [Oscillospiraceae bacterium]|nr:hypothetical protein [Oscillospiraceae bacterium]
MGYSEINCPHCGKINRESCNAYMYGSPVRICKNCGEKYIDSRYREQAISGFAPKSTNAAFYGKGSIGFGIAFACFFGWFLYCALADGVYSLRVGILCIGCLFGFIGCLIQFVRIKSGSADRENAKYLEESEKRLSDRGYVDELIKIGINVPEKYR